MAITAFSQWSTTAASNVDLNSIPLSDSMLANEIDNAFRELMAQLANAGLRTTSDTSDIITSTDAGASGGPSFIADRNSASPAANDALGRVVFRGRNSAAETFDYGYIQGEISSTTDGLERGAFSVHLYTGSTDTELMRLDLASGALNNRMTVNGDLKTGTFSATGASTGIDMRNTGILSSKSVTTSSAHLTVYNPNGAVGSISTSGTTTAYNTTSDERLKQNFRDFDAGAIIDQMTMYHYEWKTGGEGYGPKAQELEGVFPLAVTPGHGNPGDDDFLPYGWDASTLVPLLVREIQNLRARMARMEA